MNCEEFWFQILKYQVKTEFVGQNENNVHNLVLTVLVNLYLGVALQFVGVVGFFYVEL